MKERSHTLSLNEIFWLNETFTCVETPSINPNIPKALRQQLKYELENVSGLMMRYIARNKARLKKYLIELQEIEETKKKEMGEENPEGKDLLDELEALSKSMEDKDAEVRKQIQIDVDDLRENTVLKDYVKAIDDDVKKQAEEIKRDVSLFYLTNDEDLAIRYNPSYYPNMHILLKHMGEEIIE